MQAFPIYHPPQRPIAEIELLSAALLKEASPFHFHKKYLSLQKSERNVIIQTSGYCSAYRWDYTKKIHIIEPPLILGLVDSDYRRKYVNVKFSPGSLLSTIPYDSAIRIIEKSNLYAELIKYLSYQMDYHLYRSFCLSSNSTFETVCMVLIELNEMSEEVKSSVSAANFILDKTLLSRSGVMSTLASLKKKNMIVINKGKLKSINDILYKMSTF